MAAAGMVGGLSSTAATYDSKTKATVITIVGTGAEGAIHDG